MPRASRLKEAPPATHPPNDPLAGWTAEERARGYRIIPPPLSTRTPTRSTGFRITWREQASYWGGESYSFELVCDGDDVTCHATYEISPGGLRGLLEEEEPIPPGCGSWSSPIRVTRIEAERLLASLDACNAWRLANHGVCCDIQEDTLELVQSGRHHRVDLDVAALPRPYLRLLSTLDASVVGRVKREFRSQHRWAISER